MAEASPFRGKVVVVTGAAGGIGSALCRRFGRAGARIAALDREAQGLDALARTITGDGTDVATYVCDVTDFAQCEATIVRVVADLGGIDVLINNAGITHRSAFADTQVAVYRRVMDVNFFGSVHCTKAAWDALRTRRGLVVIISSVAGFAPLIGRTGYAASKHALHGFFASLRTEAASDGVGVTIVCPSFTDTNIARNALDGDGSVTTHPQSTLGRLARPEAVADAIYGAACRRQPLAVLSPVGKLARLVSALFPAYYERGMAARLKHELDR